MPYNTKSRELKFGIPLGLFYNVFTCEPKRGFLESFV